MRSRLLDALVQIRNAPEQNSDDCKIGASIPVEGQSRKFSVAEGAMAIPRVRD